MTGLKTGVQNDMFWSDTGSGLGEPSGTHQQEFPRVSPGFTIYCSNVISVLIIVLCRSQQRFGIPTFSKYIYLFSVFTAVHHSMAQTP